MGCDVHLFVEFRCQAGHFTSLTADEFSLPRDYGIFGALAGVRMEALPHIPPRGFPEDGSGYAHEAYFLRVCEDSDDRHGFDGLWFTMLPKDAEDCIKRGVSQRKTWHGSELISAPDAHHASWLTAAEYRDALAVAVTASGEPSQEYLAVAAALHVLEREDSRVVFWFDN